LFSFCWSLSWARINLHFFAIIHSFFLHSLFFITFLSILWESYLGNTKGITNVMDIIVMVTKEEQSIEKGEDTEGRN
jgi:hypothetical protein